MSEFVQITLERYESERKYLTSLARDLQKAEHERDDFKELCNKLQEYALERSIDDYYLTHHPDKCSDPNTFYFAIINKGELVEMGISIEDQVEFIKRKLEEKEND